MRSLRRPRCSMGVALAGAVACGEAGERRGGGARGEPGRPPRPRPRICRSGLALALSTFEKGADGKPVPRSELLVLTRKGGEWQARSYADPESNVFHKALRVDAAGRGAGAPHARRQRRGA